MNFIGAYVFRYTYLSDRYCLKGKRIDFVVSLIDADEMSPVTFLIECRHIHYPDPSPSLSLRVITTGIEAQHSRCRASSIVTL